MKYRIDQKHSKHVRLELSPAGRAREFVGGAIQTLPWAVVGMTMFFLPDYLGAYSKSDALTTSFWAFAAVLLAAIVLGVGYRRAFRDVELELDGRRGHLRRIERSAFWTQTESSVPCSSVKTVRVDDGLLGRKVVVALAAGDEFVAARAWFASAEILRIGEAMASIVGAEP